MKTNSKKMKTILIRLIRRIIGYNRNKNRKNHIHSAHKSRKRRIIKKQGCVCGSSKVGSLSSLAPLKPPIWALENQKLS